jgi:hypothetical protein
VNSRAVLASTRSLGTYLDEARVVITKTTTSHNAIHMSERSTRQRSRSTDWMVANSVITGLS